MGTDLDPALEVLHRRGDLHTLASTQVNAPFPKPAHSLGIDALQPTQWALSQALVVQI